MVLRELLAVFGLKFEGDGAEKADAAVGKVLHGIDTLKSALVGSFAFQGLATIVGAASELQDAQARVNALFGEGAGIVRQWATTAGDALGRSEGTLLELASAFGPVVSEFALTDEAAAGMSQTLSEAAVNISAMFGEDATEAAAALRGGLIGMDRPLKKYGIQLGEAALQEFALSQGIRQSVKDMSEATKARLRYQLLISKVSKFDGAATASLERFSGAWVRLREVANDVLEALGAVVLGPVTKLVNIASDGITAFLKWSEGTNIMQAGLLLLGVAAALALVPLLPLLVAGIKFAAIFAAAALVLDDWITFLEGGQSALEDLLNLMSEKLTGSTDAASALLAVIKTVADVIGLVGNVAAAVFLAIGGDLSGLKLLWEDFVEFIKSTGGVIGEVFAGIWEAFKDAASAAIAWVSDRVKNSLGLDLVMRGIELGRGFLSGGTSGGTAQVQPSRPVTSIDRSGDINVSVQAGGVSDPEQLASMVGEAVRVELDDHLGEAAAAVSQAPTP